MARQGLLDKEELQVGKERAQARRSGVGLEELRLVATTEGTR